MDNIESLVNRRVTNVIPDKKKLEELLKSDKKLNVYHGVDPTATRIHLGHAIGLRKLNEFAENGHNVYFLIGDFTALIGDTSDKDKERPVLTYEEIEKNFQTYKEQASKLVDFNKVKVVHNSEWLKQLKFEDVVKLTQIFSVGDFVNRELIRERLNSGKRVGLHEVLYPVMQGYDSYHLDTDVQIGGADQTFNMMAGRTLLKNLANKESFVLVTGYLEGLDGRKMSKSWGNAIWLSDTPRDMFGKVMSLRDDLIESYYNYATNLDEENVKSQVEKANNDPMGAKMDLAWQIVKELHNEDAANEAKKYFTETFQKGENPEDILEINVGERINIVDLVVKSEVVDSKSEAKRLIKEKAVKADERIFEDPTEEVEISEDGVIIKIGKKNFVKFVR